MQFPQILKHAESKYNLAYFEHIRLFLTIK